MGKIIIQKFPQATFYKKLFLLSLMKKKFEISNYFENENNKMPTKNKTQNMKKKMKGTISVYQSL